MTYGHITLKFGRYFYWLVTIFAHKKYGSFSPNIGRGKKVPKAIRLEKGGGSFNSTGIERIEENSFCCGFPSLELIGEHSKDNLSLFLCYIHLKSNQA